MVRVRNNIRDLSTPLRAFGKSCNERREEEKCTKRIRRMMLMLVRGQGGQNQQVPLIIVYYLMRKRSRIQFAPSLSRTDEVAHFDISIGDISRELCWSLFRFRKVHLTRVFNELEVPEVLILSNRCKMQGEHVFLFFLARFQFPDKLFHMERHWGRDFTILSRAIQTMVGFIAENHFHLLKDNLDFFVSRFHVYNTKIKAKTMALHGAVPLELRDTAAFWDATCHRVSRPRRNQKNLYNGAKKFHCYKTGSLYLPDGMHGYVPDLVPGRWNDNKQRSSCGIIVSLSQLLANAGQRYVVVTDKGYGNVLGFWAMYHGRTALTNRQEDVNRKISSVRVSIEWGFGDIYQTWGFIGCYRLQKSLLNPVGDYFHAATLMTNVRTCLYGNQTSDFFDCQPPTLEEYFAQ